MGPAVPVAELHHDVALLQRIRAVVEQQGSLSVEQDAVIDGRRLVVGRAVGLLTAAIQAPIGGADRLVSFLPLRIGRSVVIGGTAHALDDAKMSSLMRRFE